MRKSNTWTFASPRIAVFFHWKSVFNAGRKTPSSTPSSFPEDTASCASPSSLWFLVPFSSLTSKVKIGAPRLYRVQGTERIRRKIELLFRKLRDLCLGFVHHQHRLRQHAPHRGQSFFCISDHSAQNTPGGAIYEKTLISKSENTYSAKPEFIASIAFPESVVMDAAGNLYASNFNNSGNSGAVQNGQHRVDLSTQPTLTSFGTVTIPNSSSTQSARRIAVPRPHAACYMNHPLEQNMRQANTTFDCRNHAHCGSGLRCGEAQLRLPVARLIPQDRASSRICLSIQTRAR